MLCEFNSHGTPTQIRPQGMLRMGMGELQLSLESTMDEILKAWLGAIPGMRGMRHESFF